jgi:hypothetical protein
LLNKFVELLVLQSLFAQAPVVEWMRFYEDSVYSFGYSVRQTSDEGFIVSGYQFLCKTDAYGDIIWHKKLPGTSANSVRQTSDGGYIVTGEVYSTNKSDIYLLKTDAMGNTLWTKTYGDTGIYQYGVEVQQTLDEGYVIIGKTYYNQIWLPKTDENGDTLWTRKITGYSPEAASVCQTSDGGYIIGGGSFHGRNVKLYKTNSNGDILWTKEYSGGWGGYTQPTRDGGYIITGISLEREAFWLVKLAADPVNIAQKEPVLLPDCHLHQNYPNPFNPITTISFELPAAGYVTLKIFNTLGEEVTTLLSASLLSGFHEYEWDASGMDSGVYLYRLEVNGRVESRKMVLMKDEKGIAQSARQRPGRQSAWQRKRL